MTTGTRNLTTATLQFIEAFNVGDWEQFGTLVTPDVVYEETGTGRRVEGWDAYRQLLQGWRDALPDVRGEVLQVIADGENVAQEILWRATHMGTLQTPAGPIAPTNRTAAVQATVWYHFTGERVSAVRHHLDVMSLLQQLGILSTAGE